MLIGFSPHSEKHLSVHAMNTWKAMTVVPIKKRSKLITRIAKDLTDIVQEKGEQLPDDLEKVTMMACARPKSSLIFPVCPHLVW
jgi:hypothetical protein